MVMDEVDQLSFLVSLEDKTSGHVRKFQLIFFPSEKSVEMFDLKTRKTFLRKIVTEEVTLKDLYVGNTVTLFSRSLKITDFGDDVTKETVLPQRESCLVLIQDIQLLQEIQQAGLCLGRLKKVLLIERQAKNQDMMDWAMAGPVLGVEVVGETALSRSLDLMRPGERVLGYVSLSAEDACEDLDYFFSPCLPPLWSGGGLTEQPEVTCCIVLPHAITQAGSILSAVREGGWNIGGITIFRLDLSQAQEFLEVYKGVLAEWGDMVAQLCSGKCMVLEVLAGVQEFRQFCGPKDPSIAKVLRSGTLRSRFGENLVKNAVHCTDLPEDGPMEVEYFFKILQ